MHPRSLRFCVLLTLASASTACDKAKDKPAEQAKAESAPPAAKAADPLPSPPSPVEAKTGNQLTLGPAKLIPKKAPDSFIELLADGTVKFVGVAPGVKITADGKIMKPDGTVSGEVGVDGSLKVDGKDTGIVLDDTGLTLQGPKGGKGITVKFSADGSVVMDPPPGPDLEMTAEGCGGSIARTCGLLLAMYVMTSP